MRSQPVLWPTSRSLDFSCGDLPRPVGIQAQPVGEINEKRSYPQDGDANQPMSAVDVSSRPVAGDQPVHIAESKHGLAMRLLGLAKAYEDREG
jgi:hypothetical protein